MSPFRFPGVDLDDYEPEPPPDGCTGTPWCDCWDCRRFNRPDGQDEPLVDVEVGEPF